MKRVNDRDLNPLSTIKQWQNSMKHLVIPDVHAHPHFDNRRAEWLGKLILDVKPDRVINLGDQFDMPSLASYDRGTKSYHGRTYAADIAAGVEFSDRLWSTVKAAKKRLPHRIYIHGNHDERVGRAIELTPELEGTISYNDFQLDKYYDEIVEYTGKQTPGVYQVDGITYSHFFVSGVMGRPIGGEHPAYSLLTKQYISCTAAHIHTMDFCVRTDPHGRRLMTAVAGCYIDYKTPWAGEAQKLWWSGVLLKHDVNNGQYDPQFISMARLEKAYG